MQKKHDGRHPLLPDHLTFEELQQWIIKSAVGKFIDSTKRYFVEEEIREFEHESSANGRFINRLKAIQAEVGELITKGSIEDVTITIPKSDGTKAMDTFRRQNDDMVEKGYAEQECEIYQLVDHDNECMVFFDLSGKIIDDRTRPMSPKEKHQFLTVRKMVSLDKPTAAAGAEGQNIEMPGDDAKLTIAM